MIGESNNGSAESFRVERKLMSDKVVSLLDSNEFKVRLFAARNR
jgi:hypothetical protein